MNTNHCCKSNVFVRFQHVEAPHARTLYRNKMMIPAKDKLHVCTDVTVGLEILLTHGPDLGHLSTFPVREGLKSLHRFSRARDKNIQFTWAQNLFHNFPGSPNLQVSQLSPGAKFCSTSYVFKWT